MHISLYLRCQQLLVQRCRLQVAFLSLEVMILKNQPTLLTSFSLQNHILWDSSKQICEKAKISKEFHSCDTAFRLVLFSLDLDSSSSWSLQPRQLSAYTFWTLHLCLWVSYSVEHLPSLSPVLGRCHQYTSCVTAALSRFPSSIYCGGPSLPWGLGPTTWRLLPIV